MPSDEIVRRLETVAPKVWALMVEAERLEALTELMETGVVAVVFLVAFGVFLWALRRVGGWRNVTEHEWIIAPAALLAVITIPTLGAVSQLPGDILRYQHPEVFAAKAILERSK